MARRRKSRALFEIIRPGSDEDRERLKVPSWWRRADQRPAREPDPPGVPLSEGLWAWLRSPVPFRLPRGTLLLLGVCTVALVVLAYVVGHTAGGHAEQKKLQDSGREDLAGLRRGPVNKELIPGFVPTTGGTDAVDDGTTTIKPPDTKAKGRPDDPRQSGKNYYRVMEVPAKFRDEGERARRFLAGQGIDSTLVPINNGRSFKLVVLQGFERPLSDPQAKQFEQTLRRLGRLWKSQHKGVRDWSDLFAEKYIPGRN